MATAKSQSRKAQKANRRKRKATPVSGVQYHQNSNDVNFTEKEIEADRGTAGTDIKSFSKVKRKRPEPEDYDLKEQQRQGSPV